MKNFLFTVFLFYNFLSIRGYAQSINLENEVYKTLPFGPYIETVKDLVTAKDEFYGNLIGNHYPATKDLDTSVPFISFPKFNSISYLKLDSSKNYLCSNKMLIDSLIKLRGYRYQLPSINNYNVYYSTNSDRFLNDYSDLFLKYCKPFCYSDYGYLILHDTTKGNAIYVPIFFYNGTEGSLNYRKFYIDQTYNIFTLDGALIDGGPDEEGNQITEEFVGQWTRISFSEERLNIISAKNYDELIKKIKNTTQRTLLPFGCNDLKNNLFPASWDADWNNSENGGMPEMTKYDSLISDILNCFSDLHKDTSENRNNFIPKWFPQQIKYIPNGFKTRFADSLFQNIGYFKYRLPNIGKYKTYYCYSKVLKALPLEVSKISSYSNLVLYDTILNIANVINIYYDASTHYSSDILFFNINENKTINLYNFLSYSEGPGGRLEKVSSIDLKNNFKVTSFTNADFNLPFGCDLLNGEKNFSHTYSHDTKKSTQLKLKQKRIDDFLECLGKLNQVNPMHIDMMISNAKWIDNGFNYSESIKEEIISKKSDILFQLPKFGEYQCYYAYWERTGNPKNLNSKIGAIGNLIFINESNNKLKLLNVYLSYIGDKGKNHQNYFYIDQNATIMLFRNTITDLTVDGVATVKHEHQLVSEITVNKSGTFNKKQID